MKFADIKELTSSELRKRMVTLREELFEARMKHTLGQLGSPIEIRYKRKDLARLKTALVMKLGQGGAKASGAAKSASAPKAQKASAPVSASATPKAPAAPKASGAKKSVAAKKTGKTKG